MYNAVISKPNPIDMNISLNGDAKDIEEGIYLNQLIENMGLTGKRLAVEINREIIPKSQHAEYEIKQGDVIEIVHAIGGG